MQLQINGKLVQVDADPAMPLLWLLRDVLDMTGTKYGCGVGRRAAAAMRLLPARHADGGDGVAGEKPMPTDAGIDAAISNLCRSGTYQRVGLAIHRAGRSHADGGAGADQASASAHCRSRSERAHAGGHSPAACEQSKICAIIVGSAHHAPQGAPRDSAQWLPEKKPKDELTGTKKSVYNSRLC